MAKLYEWKCPKCGKEINSTHEGQFGYNKKLHIDSHNYIQRKKPLKPKELKEQVDNNA